MPREAGPSTFVPCEAAFRRRPESVPETARGIARREERPGDLALLERDLTERDARAVAAFPSGDGRSRTAAAARSNRRAGRQ